MIKKTNGVQIGWAIGLTVMMVFMAVGGVGATADPLSRDGLQPTLLQFTDDVAIAADTLGGFPDVIYFMVTVPNGHELASIKVLSDEASDNGYWFAVMSGEQFGENSTNQNEINVDNILGHTLIGSAADTNVLPQMADGIQGRGAIGFDEVLPAGSYSFRLQNWNSGGVFELELGIVEADVTPSTIQLYTQTTSTLSQKAILSITMLFILLVITTSFPISIRKGKKSLSDSHETTTTTLR